MRLSQWMKETHVSQTEFADLTGIDQSLLSKYLKHVRRPNVDQALAIERATKGAVPVEEWAKKKRAA